MLVVSLLAPTTPLSMCTPWSTDRREFFFSDHTIAVTGFAIAALLVSRRWGGGWAVVGVAGVAVGAALPN